MSEAVEQKENAPEGYRRVQIGPEEFLLPKDWNVIKLGNDEYTQRTMGGTPDTSVDEYWDGEIPWMRSGDLHQKYITDVEGRITEKGKESSRAELIPKHSVLVGLNGQGKTKGTVAINEIPLTANQSVGAYLVNHEKLDHRYLFFSLEAKYSRLRALAGGGRSGLNLKLLGQVKIPYPPLPEQRRIADILSTVDEQIQQTDEIIDEAKELKKGLMQDLLHKGIGHSEFKEMYIGPKRSTLPVDWDVVQLGEIADIQSGSTPKRSNEEYWDNGTIPWIKSGEFNDGVVSKTEEYITEKALEESGCVVFPQGTLLIALYGKGTVSKTARLGIDATTNQAIAGLLPESGDFDPRYLQYYLIDSRNTLLNVTVNPSSDTGRTNIYMSALRQFKVALPPLEEQEEIADRISAVDDKISDEADYKQHLKDLKRGLMQDLLSGKVRVNTD